MSTHHLALDDKVGRKGTENCKVNKKNMESKQDYSVNK